MSDDVLNSIIERVNGAADPQVKGLFINAINELTLHEKKVTSNLQKIKNALRPFTTQNRDKLVDCAIDLSEYAYQHIDHPNPFYLQKFCEFLLLRKEVDLVIEHIEAFIKHNKNNTERNSIEFITITLASAYSWKDKKYLVKAISLLEDLKSSSMRVKDNLAKLYYNNSNFDKVLELAESSGDMNSQLALWYGKSLFQLGKVNEAISALETFRHDKDVEKFLDQIRIQQRVFLPTINCKPAKVFIITPATKYVIY